MNVINSVCQFSPSEIAIVNTSRMNQNYRDWRRQLKFENLATVYGEKATPIWRCEQMRCCGESDEPYCVDCSVRAAQVTCALQ